MQVASRLSWHKNRWTRTVQLEVVPCCSGSVIFPPDSCGARLMTSSGVVDHRLLVLLRFRFGRSVPYQGVIDLSCLSPLSALRLGNVGWNSNRHLFPPKLPFELAGIRPGRKQCDVCGDNARRTVQNVVTDRSARPQSESHRRVIDGDHWFRSETPMGQPVGSTASSSGKRRLRKFWRVPTVVC